MRGIRQSEHNLKGACICLSRKGIRLLLVLFFGVVLSGNSCRYCVLGANESPVPNAESSGNEGMYAGSGSETTGSLSAEPAGTAGSFNVESMPGTEGTSNTESMPGTAGNSGAESAAGTEESANAESAAETEGISGAESTDGFAGTSDSNVVPGERGSSFADSESNMTDSSLVGNGAEATDSSVAESLSEEEIRALEAAENEPISMNKTTVEVCSYAFYTGKAVCPKPVISFQDADLIENTDYQVSYTDNIKVGTATMTIIGTGRYTGKVSREFQIVNVKLTTKYAKYSYTGWARQPAAVTTGAPYDLQKNVDYTLSYKNNKKCGKATITLTGCGKWYGTLSANFTLYLPKLTLKSVTSPMNLRMVALWTPDKYVTGYQLRYEIDGKKETITMPGSNRKGKTLYQLPKDKICTVNVRSYLEQDGKTLYSSWSNTKSVKIRYRDWYVTQYESVTGNQAMIYTITDRYNRLILIDGGYTEDADQVRKIIRSHGNRVYAWILTHPHPDHIEAFNEIITTDKDIVVDKIYATKVNSKRYHETDLWYDEIGVYDTFRKIAPKLNNITYLKDNDTFSCLGLTFKVLHGWDSNVDALKKDLCNDGSLMFKVSGKVKSMLFCADTQKEMQKFIYPGHKKELAVDYVQCGHHGNRGLSHYFYSLVDAEVAFMDAPPWLFISGGKYDAYKLRDYLQSRGTKVYRYDGKTHRVRIT